ncbi:MAG: YkgJ family cysteine cluster protein [Planctomycetota bacterium]|jgi:Fe-S-cluster containining protein
MVVRQQAYNRLLKRVAEIYGWLDLQIGESIHLAGVCDACGECCDFAQLDHRLFVTTPELMYLAANLSNENIKSMPTSRGSTSLTTGCPYNEGGQCTIYEYRFAGCRIFCCKADADFQSRLSESALKKFKSLCTEFQIPYRYTDLATALNELAG